jgi:predicted ester cyclase
VADDIVNHQPEVEPRRGRTQFATEVRGVMKAVPDSRWTISDLLVDGDRVAARITWAGTYGPGPFRGVTVEESRDVGQPEPRLDARGAADGEDEPVDVSL